MMSQYFRYFKVMAQKWWYITALYNRGVLFVNTLAFEPRLLCPFYYSFFHNFFIMYNVSIEISFPSHHCRDEDITVQQMQLLNISQRVVTMHCKRTIWGIYIGRVTYYPCRYLHSVPRQLPGLPSDVIPQ